MGSLILFFTCLKSSFFLLKLFPPEKLKNGREQGCDYGQDKKVHDQPSSQQETNGRRRFASGAGDCSKDRGPRSAGQDVQDDGRRHLRLRVPHAFRRKQNHRLRSHLRQHGQREEVRTQVPIGPTRRYREEEDGARYRQGQGGRGRQEEEVKQTAEKTFASDSPTTIQRIDGDLVARSKETGVENRLHLRRKRISILFASFRPFSVHLVSFRVKYFLFLKSYFVQAHLHDVIY